MAENTSSGDEPNPQESAFTMLEVLEEDTELELEANAVLGDSDDQCCTYPKGYLGRQALYACGTCVTGEMDLAGLCLACSYSCHEGHDLFELYTKRKFRCDCGNDKFPSNVCKLHPSKDPTNADNGYNHNFSGRYCICDRPYPDPEDNIEDEMIQCIVCEDWYHGRHLGITPPENMDYHEMICRQCMSRLKFLWAYTVNSFGSKLIKEETSEQVEVEIKTNKEEKVPVEAHSEEKSGSDIDSKNNSGIKFEDTKLVGEEMAEKNNTKTDSASTSKPSEIINKAPCQLDELKQRDYAVGDFATFWPFNWRSKLCICDNCQGMYRAEKVEFLLDLSDTVQAYEERGRAKQGDLYDQGMQALSNLNRVQQVEAIHEYNDLKDQLKDYLKAFADRGEVVSEENIREFFVDMQDRKRRRVEPNISHHCH